jgi:hypothetical protein
MATLIQEAAEVRAESRRLRSEMFELKLALRESAGHSLEQRRTALEAFDRVRDRLDTPLPSPWSTLYWSHNYRPLADVLVPVP